MSTEDARPFASLKHNAENFITGFNEDIENCSALLNEKITDLIRDPDSLGASTQLKKGADAHIEFSKAKFNIFLSMKSHFDEMEENWSSMIQQMKKDFLENVEIFLAETKLEVKLPASPSITSKKSRLSFASGKQEVLQAVSSSIYPLISSLTTKVPALVTSPLGGSSSTSPMKDDKRFNDKKGLKSSQKEGYFQEEFNDSDEESDSDDSCKQEELPKPPVKKSGRPARKVTKNTISEPSEYSKQPLTKGGRPRKGTTNGFDDSAGVSELVETSVKVNMRNTRRAAKPTSSGTPKITSRRKKQTKNSDDEMEFQPSVIEQAAEDIVNELDMLPTPSKSRRKTMFVPQIINEDLSDQEPSPEKILRTKAKRKTMAGISDFTASPAPKRLKSRGRKSTSPANEEDDTKDNLLDGGDSTELGNYSSWVDLKSVNNIPALSGIYELKVWRAKKPAFIGSCENLRHTLTLHKLGQNSGHKHLDKFLERNLKDVSVRYETASSIQEAKTEAKSRIANFVQIHKTTPAYN